MATRGEGFVADYPSGELEKNGDSLLCEYVLSAFSVRDTRIAIRASRIQ